ncbi:MAG: DUF4325 domain-containing protein [Sedimentisphaerales bacterium]|nr:DUF4325 domain-containing protein [Sedimentisphaerales bacterium]
MGEYTIRIPSQNMAGGARDMRSWLQTWRWRTRFGYDVDALALDFTNTEFIEPWALALFTAYALKVKHDRQISVRAILSPRSPSNVYIGEMGLNDVLETGTSTQDWDSSSQNTGLHVLRTHQDVSRFVQSAARLGLGPGNETMDALKYGMAELGRNVIQHSASPVGGIAIAQLFPERKAIQIAIADPGVGVLKSLGRAYPELKNHLESLKQAVLPHVSGAFKTGMYSTSENAGLGLFFSKEICWRAGGSFWIASHTALLGVVGREDVSMNRVYREINEWHGTLVAIDLPEEGVSDFGSLLSLCRDLAAKARGASGEAGLDFLEESPELDGVTTIKVGELNEDVQAAVKLRDSTVLPAVRQGELIVLDFAGIRFVTQSFVHALLNDAFRVPGSLLRLSFLNCSKSTREAIAAVAAYSASYRQCV